MKEKDFGKNWAKALGFLLASEALAVVFYMLFSIIYGSPWPDAWDKRVGYWYFLLFGNLILLAIACYVTVSKRINVEEVLDKVLDVEINRVQNQKPMEAILSHYGNMASMGLFMAILVFTIKPLVAGQSIIWVGPILAIGYFIIICSYSMILVKPLFYFCKYNQTIAITAMLIVFSIDMQGFRLFLSSVP
tara:strand:+ start:1364 stop:1933 length:570 start_codon:yes stop_codon:yes gene_type:complete